MYMYMYVLYCIVDSNSSSYLFCFDRRQKEIVRFILYIYLYFGGVECMID